ncbi:hypothetical protein OIU74_003959 [Salix koriyanagi]|uniref:CBS domain-containing protein n=1 Tax=Salix koriyanagi TaxID=2511006 RepID=A0A9Q0UZ60_9ROSI|nr:hypothetical protein OIU74_003959 [Salix koriyanagi]
MLLVHLYFSSRSFGSEEHVGLAYGDNSLAEALHILWQSRTGVVAVVNRENMDVIGCMRNSDVYLLPENNELLGDRQQVSSKISSNLCYSCPPK